MSEPTTEGLVVGVQGDEGCNNKNTGSIASAGTGCDSPDLEAMESIRSGSTQAARVRQKKETLLGRKGKRKRTKAERQGDSYI